MCMHVMSVCVCVCLCECACPHVHFSGHALMGLCKCFCVDLSGWLCLCSQECALNNSLKEGDLCTTLTFLW